MRIVTYMSLPPRPLPAETVARVLEAVLDTWIAPDRYGHIEATRQLPAGAHRRAQLLDSYTEHHDLVLAQRSGDVSLEIVPPRPGQVSFARYIAWEGPRDAGWLERDTHRDEVWRVARLAGAPLAIAAASEARSAYALRVEQDAFGEKLVPTVPDYTRGLQHPHWRMWFGGEYRDFLGPDALAAAPAAARHDLGDGYFVEVHEDPAAWDRPGGRAAAAAFAAAMPRRVFFDPGEPAAGLEAPDFSHLLPGDG